ncbi:hypothetical protein N9R07_03080 [Flavobacteriaceae bacterium]|nr:hypothetical protein [Flavobacteriaceae bacterium]
MTRQQKRKLERNRKKNFERLTTSHEYIMGNIISLKKCLEEVKEGKGIYSPFFQSQPEKKELQEFIQNSLFPDEENGIENHGTSNFPNFYKGSDKPIWIIGNMGSVWFDCKTSKGNFHRISLREYQSGVSGFHVEDSEYHIYRNRFEIQSQIDPDLTFPSRKELYEMIRWNKEMNENGTSYELVDKHIRVSRDFSELNKITGSKNLQDNIECTIKKVKGGFEYFDLKHFEEPRFWEDGDRMIWEYNLPREMRKDILKLEES